MNILNKINKNMDPREYPDNDEGNLKLYYELELLRSGYEVVKAEDSLRRYATIIDELAERGLYVDFTSELQIDVMLRKVDWDELIGKPFGPFKDWGACMTHMTKPKSKGGEGYSKDTAEKVCGKMEAQHKEKE